ncbi:MAG: protein kinase [Nitrospiraceae bacterium]
MLGRAQGHYRIVEKIGAGGMGEVYRATDTRLERDVALKVLPSGTLADEAARKRFRKEALALAKLNHPHIATFLTTRDWGSRSLEMLRKYCAQSGWMLSNTMHTKRGHRLSLSD